MQVFAATIRGEFENVRLEDWRAKRRERCGQQCSKEFWVQRPANFLAGKQGGAARGFNKGEQRSRGF